MTCDSRHAHSSREEIRDSSAEIAALGLVFQRRLLLCPGPHLAKAFDRFARTEFLELEEGTDLALALSAKAQRASTCTKRLVHSIASAFDVNWRIA